jgi:hypothetical protein
MITYFKKFPLAGYNLGVPESNQPTQVTNIFHRARIREVVNVNALVFYEYIVRDGETPEIIADKYYGSPQYFWVVMFANDMIDPYFDWVLSYDNFNAMIIKNFTSLVNAQSTIDHYEDPQGNVIDFTTFTNTPGSRAVNIYDTWFARNEAKRKIKLLDKSFLSQIDTEFDNLLSHASAS